MKKVLVQLPIVSLLCLAMAFPAFAEGNGAAMNTNRGIGTYGTYDTNGTTEMYRYYQQGDMGTRNNGMFGNRTFNNRDGMPGINNNRMNGNYRTRAAAADTNDTNWSWLGLLGLLGLAGMFRGTNDAKGKSRT